MNKEKTYNSKKSDGSCDPDRFGANNIYMIKLIQQNLITNFGLTLSGSCNFKSRCSFITEPAQGVPAFAMLFKNY